MKITQDKLEPCPFCGGEADLNSERGVVCSFCGAKMQYDFDPKKQVSIKAWNTRTCKENAENVSKNCDIVSTSDALKALHEIGKIAARNHCYDDNFDSLWKIVRQALQSRFDSDWLPIGTLPEMKDCDSVLLFVPEHDGVNEHMVIGVWSESKTVL